MKTIKRLLSLALLTILFVPETSATTENRALWGSLCGRKDAMLGSYQAHLGKVLVSWRLLPTDTEATGFDLYRTIGTGSEERIVANLRRATCFQDTKADLTQDLTYRLTYAGRTETLDTYTMKAEQASGKLPYISIPLKDTHDVDANESVTYKANDCTVGDLDGDGQMEVVVKRLLYVNDEDNSSQLDNDEDPDKVSSTIRHHIVFDAYKLDGTLLWRVKSGPNIMLGNSSCIAVADLDGDGRAELVIRTAEGTVFGDGQEIGDINGDGKTDYRREGTQYMNDGPEFFSVIDGMTGRELARANDIPRETSQSWGDNYWKRASSLRLGIASFDGVHNHIVLGRGVYARTVIEAWRYADGQLTRLWHFDSSDTTDNQNHDGKPNSAYAGQGNHSFSVADLDGDGRDEVMWGSMAIDDDGHGLWSTGLGHGDAQHVGKFLPDRDGLQVFHCLESGTTQVALHDGATGALIWDKQSATAGDMGRCCVGDIDPSSPGCEFWMAGSNAFSATGQDLGFKPYACNMMIWFDGTLSRQHINENVIQSDKHGRTFTMYRYGITFINGSKSNPGWYGDFLGDWREEVIVADATQLQELRVFSTWYPTDYRFPWLMTDHTYLMSALNENVGYNQPTHTGYYLGTDLIETIKPEAGNATIALSAVDAKTWDFSNFPGLPSTINEPATYDNLYIAASSERPMTYDKTALTSEYNADSQLTDGLLQFRLPVASGQVVVDYYSWNSNNKMNIVIGDDAFTDSSKDRRQQSLSYNGTTETDVLIYTTGAARSHSIYSIAWIPDGIYETVSIGATGLATYCPPVNVTIPSGLKVWYLTAIGDGTVTLTEAKGVLPALSGVLLQGQPDTEYTFTKTAAKATTLSGNLMSGTWFETTSTDTDNVWYALALNNEGRPAFLPINPAYPIPAFKAYFKVSKTTAAHSYAIETITTPTSVNDAISKMADVGVTFYDLQGRKVSPLKKGLYISNHRKIVIK